MTDKLRKYVLPNIPYVFIGWVFLKLGTAYRLAAGGDFAHKLLGLGIAVHLLRCCHGAQSHFCFHLSLTLLFFF